MPCSCKGVADVSKGAAEESKIKNQSANVPNEQGRRTELFLRKLKVENSEPEKNIYQLIFPFIILLLKLLDNTKNKLTWHYLKNSVNRC